MHKNCWEIKNDIDVLSDWFVLYYGHYIITYLMVTLDMAIWPLRYLLSDRSVWIWQYGHHVISYQIGQFGFGIITIILFRIWLASFM